MKAIIPDSTMGETPAPPTILLGGAAVLALLSASCCVLPIGLSIIGLGGSWLTFLGPIVTYRLPILAGLAIILGWSWFTILRPSACKPKRKRATRYTSTATAAFLIAASAPLWQVSVDKAMWSLWSAMQ